MIRLTSIWVVLICIVFCCFYSCQTYNVEKKLDPESREFLSSVKILITPEERKGFLKLPFDERESFIEEFWKRRDPEPETEGNEFKEAYFTRIDNANNLYRGASKYSLTDRGKIFVLFGPPDDIYRSEDYKGTRNTNTEVWLYTYILDKYHNMRFYFEDRTGGGNFRFAHGNQGGSVFSILQEARYYYADLGKGVKIKKEEKSLKFHVLLKKADEKENDGKFPVQLKIPYESIWFSESEDNMGTTLSLEMEILDTSGTGIWKHKQEFPLSFVKKDLEERVNIKKNHIIDIAPTISRTDVPKGKYSLTVSLTNSSGGQWKKVLKIEL